MASRCATGRSLRLPAISTASRMPRSRTTQTRRLVSSRPSGPWQTSRQSVAEATRILQIMQTEIDAVNEAIKKGLQPSTVYARLGDSLDKAYNVATGGGSAVTDLFPPGRYLDLALTNWDHFGTHAITAYTSGHRAAMAQAIAARKVANPTAKRAQLELRLRDERLRGPLPHRLVFVWTSAHAAEGALRRVGRRPPDRVVPGQIHARRGLLLGTQGAERHGAAVDGVRRQEAPRHGEQGQRSASSSKPSRHSVDEIYSAYTTGSLAPLQALHYVPQLTAVAGLAGSGRTRRRCSSTTDSRCKSVTISENRYDYSWTRWWTAPGHRRTIAGNPGRRAPTTRSRSN